MSSGSHANLSRTCEVIEIPSGNVSTLAQGTPSLLPSKAGPSHSQPNLLRLRQRLSNGAHPIVSRHAECGQLRPRQASQLARMRQSLSQLALPASRVEPATGESGAPLRLFASSSV